MCTQRMTSAETSPEMIVMTSESGRSSDTATSLVEEEKLLAGELYPSFSGGRFSWVTE